MKIFVGIFLLIFFAGCKRTQEGLEHPSKKVKDMSLSEALHAARYYKGSGQTELAIQSLEQAITKSDEHTQTEHLVLELGDTLLASGDFERAQKVYHEFKTFYPGSSSIEYALYQELLAHHLACLCADRDQTNTKTAISLGEAFLARFAQSEYATSVRTTINLAYKTLYEHELHQVEFYLNKFNYEPYQGPLLAACQRLKYIQGQLLSHLEIADKVKVAQLQTIISTALNTFEETTLQPSLLPDVLQQQAAQLSLVLASAQQIIFDTTLSHARDRF